MVACFLGEQRSGLFDVGCLLGELSGLVFFLGDRHSGLEHCSGGGMSGRLESDESGFLGVFLSSISRNRLDVEFGLGKCMKYFSLGLFILVVDGRTFDQSCKYLVNWGIWRNIGLTSRYLVSWGIWRNVGQTCRYLVSWGIWRNIGQTCTYLVNWGISRNVGQTCRYLVNWGIWRNIGQTCKYLVDWGIWRNVDQTCKYLVDWGIWRNVGQTCKYLVDWRIWNILFIVKK